MWLLERGLGQALRGGFRGGGGLNENAQPFQGYLWYNCTSPDLVTVVPDALWVAWEGRVGRCGLPVLERTR